MSVETDINKRWERGIPHHPKSEALFESLRDIDLAHGGDYFCWKSGGDGDNGEHFMYELDIHFEQEEAAGAAHAHPGWRHIKTDPPPEDGTPFVWLNVVRVIAAGKPVTIEYHASVVQRTWFGGKNTGGRGYWRAFARSVADHELTGYWAPIELRAPSVTPEQVEAEIKRRNLIEPDAMFGFREGVKFAQGRQP